MTATMHEPTRTAEPIAPQLVAEDGPPQTQVVTVFSPKGGAGTTIIATNLAMALHGAGVRVCLVDLAIAFGDVAVNLQLVPQRSIVDTMELGTTSEAVHELITTHPSGLDCVLAPVDPTGLERLPVAMIGGLIRTLQARYDVVVIDTPSELSEHVLEAVDASDRLLLVTTPEIPAIKNTRIALDMLDLLGHPRERRTVLLNQVDDSLGITLADVTGALQCEIVTQLPYDRAVPLSVNLGVPFVVANPTHRVSQALRALAAQTVAGAATLMPVARTGRLRRGRRSA